MAREGAMLLRSFICTGLLFLLFFSFGCKGSGPTDPGKPLADTNTITWGGPGTDMASAVAIDGHGNVYVIGQYLIEDDNGTYDLDPGEDISPHRMEVGNNFFLSKFDGNGNLVWSRVWYVYGEFGSIRDVACDGEGNSYVSAVFRGTVDIDPGPERNMISSPDNSVLGIMRFDPVGNMQWYAPAGESKNNRTEFYHGKIEVDDSGNVFLFGAFEGEADFDPGPQEDIHVSISRPWAEIPDWAGGDNETGGSPEYLVYEPVTYLCAYDSQGRFKWCRTWEAYYSYSGGSASDGAGGVYVTGFFRGIIDMDPGEGIEIRGDGSGNNGYLSRFDTAGNLAWVRTWDGDNTFECKDVASNGSGDALLIGTFRDDINLDPTPGNENNPRWWIETGNNRNMGLLRFSRSGAFKGATVWEGISSNNDLDIFSSPDGTTWILGTFSNEIDFDPGPGTAMREMSYHQGLFLCSLTPSGLYKWVRVWTYPSFYYTRDVAAGPDGYAWVAMGSSGAPVWGSVTEKRNWPHGDYDCSLTRFSSEGN